MGAFTVDGSGLPGIGILGGFGGFGHGMTAHAHRPVAAGAGIQLQKPGAFVRPALKVFRHVASHAPNNPESARQDEVDTVARLLKNSLTGVSQGELAPFNYVKVTQPAEDGEWGADAWAHIDQMRSESPSSNENILTIAFEEGVGDLLPFRSSIYEYGAGGEMSVRENTLRFIDLVKRHGRTSIHSYTNVDLSEDLSQIAPAIVKDRGIASNALTGDVLNEVGPELQGDGDSLVLSFGCPFQNAPAYFGDDAPDLCQIITEYMANMALRHGMGSQFVMPFPVAATVEYLLNKYPETAKDHPQTERFVLSSLRYAADIGAIQNKNYRVLDHWTYFRDVVEDKVDVDGDTFVAHKVISGGVAKKDHTLRTPLGSIRVKKGQKIVTINSHVPSKALYAYAASVAGYDVTTYKRRLNGGSSNSEVLFHGVATRKPTFQIAG